MSIISATTGNLVITKRARVISEESLTSFGRSICLSIYLSIYISIYIYLSIYLLVLFAFFTAIMLTNQDPTYRFASIACTALVANNNKYLGEVNTFGRLTLTNLLYTQKYPALPSPSPS